MSLFGPLAIMAYGRTMGSFLSLGSLMVMDATMAKQGHMVTDLSLGDTPYMLGHGGERLSSEAVPLH